MVKIAIIFSLALSAYSHADYIKANNTKITQVSTYGPGGVAGDIVVKISSPVASFEGGYYLKNDASGKNETLSIALSAFHSGANIHIHAFDTPRWGGSTGNYCVIEGIHLTK